MKEENQKAMLWIAIATILFMELLVFGGSGIAVPIAIIIYYVLILWQSKVLKVKINIKNNLLLIPIAAISLCFVLFDNTFLKTLNVILLYILIMLDTSQQFGINNFEFMSFKWFMEVIPVGIITPLENIMEPINLVRAVTKEKSKISINAFFKILIGFIIGMPIVCIVALLLMNTDVAFESVVRLISKNFSFNLLDVLERIIIFIFVFLPLYSFFYGIRSKREKICNSKEEKNQIKVQFDFIIIITIASLVCMLYIIYCLSQFTYFVSAFQGILPEDYTFAGYARKGFFECIPLGIINLLFIIMMGLFTKVEDSKRKEVLIKGFIYYIITFTLFLVISAFSKMWLYISNYGITLARVYAAWFLILVSIILVFIGIKVYYRNFKLAKNIFIASTIMFLGLNYANIDYRIAEYDAELYIDGKVDTISVFGELSNSALESLIKISKIEKKRSEALLKEYENRVNNKVKWQDWNLANYNARKELKTK